MINWHRLFGLALTDLFTDSPYIVELEKDLSLRQQFLDVVILKKQPGSFAGQIPDGLDNLAAHNLLSYKSIHEPLDDWTLDELLGHFVNYRKQLAPARSALLPKAAFRLYGVTTRFPKKLAEQINLQPVQTGVYEVGWGLTRIRVLVLSEMPQAEYNAVWHLFSGVQNQVAYGASHYRNRTSEMSTILNQLFENYHAEGLEMSYTMEDFRRDYIREHAAEILKQFSAEELKGYFHTAEILEQFSAEERLQSLSLEELKDYLAKLEQQQKQAKENEE